MVLKVFTVLDLRVNMYLQPFFNLEEGHAMRAFENSVSDPGTNFHRFPDEYQLFEVGTYDEKTGNFENFPKKKLLATARSVLLKIQSSQMTLSDKKQEPLLNLATANS